MTSLFVNNVQLRVTVKRTVVRSVPTSSGEHTVGNATFAEPKATISSCLIWAFAFLLSTLLS